MRRWIPVVVALAGLAACSTEQPSPAAMPQAELRAPTLPPGSLLVALPGVPPVTRGLRAELTRGGAAVCGEIVDAVLLPAENGLFRLVTARPGLLVTRETVLRRTDAPPGAPELALEGANNGRCDYLLRTAELKGA